MRHETTWAEETFARADLKDRRLTRRLVQMADAAARQPGGTVTSVMRSSAEAEGAFRFLESARIDPQDVTDAMCTSTAAACSEYSLVYVAVDQTDLTFKDPHRIRGLGPDNAKMSKVLRTSQVMNALVLDERGVPVGLLDQQWWLRSEEKAPHWKMDRRAPEDRESHSWVRTIEACEGRIGRLAPGCRPWYILDRGSDLSTFLRPCLEEQRLFTARAAHNRVIKDSRGRRRKLFPTLCRQPTVGTLSISIPRGADRLARLAQCEVRILPSAAIRLGREFYKTSVVFVRETGYVPEGQERISWRLLTSFAVTDFRDAKAVIRAYTLRWRVEEFHRTWKSGGCNVESSQLRSYDAIKRWATILAAVATRVERLKRLSRETPDADALTEFSRAELDVAIAMNKSKRWKPGDQMCLRDAVRLIAMVGGFMGRKGDGEPGSITIRRGLERVVPAAQALQFLGRSG